MRTFLIALSFKLALGRPALNEWCSHSLPFGTRRRCLHCAGAEHRRDACCEPSEGAIAWETCTKGQATPRTLGQKLSAVTLMVSARWRKRARAADTAPVAGGRTGRHAVGMRAHSWQACYQCGKRVVALYSIVNPPRHAHGST